MNEFHVQLNITCILNRYQSTANLKGHEPESYETVVSVMVFSLIFITINLEGTLINDQTIKKIFKEFGVYTFTLLN